MEDYLVFVLWNSLVELAHFWLGVTVDKKVHLEIIIDLNTLPTRTFLPTLFSTGVAKPSYGHGTLVVVPLLPENAESQDIWSASLVDAYDNVVIVQVSQVRLGNVHRILLRQTSDFNNIFIRRIR